MGLPEMTDLSTSGSFFFFSFLRFSFLLFCGRTGAEASACAGRGYCGCKLTDFFSFLLFLSFFSFFFSLLILFSCSFSVFLFDRGVFNSHFFAWCFRLD